MEKLLPDHLQEFWHSVVQKQRTAEEYTAEYERLLGEHRTIWSDALSLEGHHDLKESLLSELGSYVGCEDTAEIQLRCHQAVANVKREWQAVVDPSHRQSVEQFYDQSEAMLYELMGWHTLSDDSSPLAYVTALQFAQQRGCRRALDFGAGVGSGAILFARHGLQIALADISSPLLHFSQWRLERRRLPAQYIDLKINDLPRQAFDLVTAMDVFEHLVDPVKAAEHLWEALKPGGFLYARIAAEVDEDRPQHIVQDFGPTFHRMQALGFIEVWRDEWLWGHQVFRKS
ncbi:MAG: class I SAM-dependent methyltransferase [Nitrospinae bacterium]|nr:class I SAM-dependent methyltransferase [Nitrospinota bacterium]